MRSKQQSPVWPYLGILACLFVLSITAPRAWKRMARQESLSQVLAARRSVTADVRVSAEPVRRPKLERPKSVEPARPFVLYETSDSEELNARTALLDPPPAQSQAAQSLPEQPPAAPPAPEVTPDYRLQIDTVSRSTVTESEPETDDEPAMEPAEAEAEIASEVAPPSIEEEPAVASSKWPLPRTLLEQLKHVVRQDPSAAWAEQAAAAIRELCQSGVEGSESIKIIKSLRELMERTPAPTAVDPPLEAQIARTRYALVRWLDLWESAVALDQLAPADLEPPLNAARLARCVADVEQLTRKGSQGATWRAYLHLDSLRKLASEAPNLSDKERRAIARKVLDQLGSSRLSRVQRKFVSEPALVRLEAELHYWAAEPVSSYRLLSHLDQYEQTALTSDARLVADDLRGLSWSQPAAAAHISQQLETHYRNANVRMALAGELINRMLPQPEKIEAPVRDIVVNVPVFGRSTTFTKLSVRLVPDPRRIRVGLEAKGLIASDTVSQSGPATFRNEGQSSFLVRKLLVLGPHGLSVWPAVAEAENDFSYLVSLETDFDGVPLVGSLVRNIAQSKHDEASGQARMEVEQKIATRARAQLDDEIRPLLVQAAQNVQKNQVATLNRMGLELAPLALSTTDDRIVARMRLGSPEQLGGHTPRPRAPSDSWFSLQIHQSALNNGLEKLDLAGRTFSLPEMFAWLGAKLGRPQLANQEDLPEDVQLTFAQENPVQLRCDAGEVEVTLRFAQLTHGGKRWRDFKVRAIYTPQPNRLDPRFGREAAISIDGKSLNKWEVQLRTIFSKVLSRNRDISLLDESITSDPRVKDLEMTQFIVEDGWIGLAYSPHRAPRNMAKQAK